MVHNLDEVELVIYQWFLNHYPIEKVMLTCIEKTPCRFLFAIDEYFYDENRIYNSQRTYLVNAFIQDQKVILSPIKFEKRQPIHIKDIDEILVQLIALIEPKEMNNVGTFENFEDKTGYDTQLIQLWNNGFSIGVIAERLGYLPGSLRNRKTLLSKKYPRILLTNDELKRKNIKRRGK